MKIIKKRYSLILGFLISLSVSAERYSVNEDSFGGVSAKAVDTGAEIEEASSISIEPSQDLSLPSTELVSTQNQSEQTKPEKNQPEQINQESNLNDQDKVDASGIEPATKRKLSVFEKAYYESEKKAKAEALKNITKNINNQETPNTYDATEIDPIKFMDGDELARTGKREEVEKAPYFITVDVDGKPQNTFYDPVLVGEALDKQRNQKIEYTQARVYEKFSQQSKAKLDLPDSADPVAVQLLNAGKKEFDLYFKAFTNHCCEQLPNIVTPSVEFGRSRAFELTNDDLYYRFNDGDSRFLLISLPSETNENYPLRIRSFIRTFKNLSIDYGVFFPQIVTLNAAQKPVRILTGPVLKYQAETWSTHGYLEGVFQIDRSEEKDERYVLINTTSEVLRQSSVIDTEEPIEITHMSVGSFEIEAILEE